VLAGAVQLSCRDCYSNPAASHGGSLSRLQHQGPKCHDQDGATVLPHILNGVCICQQLVGLCIVVQGHLHTLCLPPPFPARFDPEPSGCTSCRQRQSNSWATAAAVLPVQLVQLWANQLFGTVVLQDRVMRRRTQGSHGSSSVAESSRNGGSSTGSATSAAAPPAAML
jgi:hypothetical protein